jgi:hypothetical protein
MIRGITAANIRDEIITQYPNHIGTIERVCSTTYALQKANKIEHSAKMSSPAHSLVTKARL